jgi:hypothetical protein
MVIVAVITWYASGGNAMFSVTRDRRNPHFFEGMGSSYAPSPGAAPLPPDQSIPAPPGYNRNHRLESLIRAGRLEEAVELCVNPNNLDDSLPLETRRLICSHYLGVIDSLNRRNIGREDHPSEW